MYLVTPAGTKILYLLWRFCLLYPQLASTGTVFKRSSIVSVSGIKNYQTSKDLRNVVIDATLLSNVLVKFDV